MRMDGIGTDLVHFPFGILFASAINMLLYLLCLGLLFPLLFLHFLEFIFILLYIL